VERGSAPERFAIASMSGESRRCGGWVHGRRGAVGLHGRGKAPGARGGAGIVAATPSAWTLGARCPRRRHSSVSAMAFAVPR
jgi:hypothetical protein